MRSLRLLVYSARPARVLGALGDLGGVATRSDIPYDSTVRDRNKFRRGLPCASERKEV
jgi:hypothetical protein